jgi:kumamolisin
MAHEQVELPGSHRDAPEGARLISAVPPTEAIEVSIYLKNKEDTGDLLAQGPMKTRPVKRAQIANAASSVSPETRVETYRRDIGDVSGYASRMGLAVTKQDPARRLVKVRGTARQIEAAFGTKLHNYNGPGGVFRARIGSLSLPADVVGNVEAVLGLDTRPIAKPRLQQALPHTIGGHLPNEIARLYAFPAGRTGKGQCIALIELGGGVRASDNAAAFAAMGLPVPTVLPISVSGGQNLPGVDPNADGEVALDVQVAGGAAPGARIAVYFAPNTVQGFVDAITRAVHDPVNRPSVISISWGSAERHWTPQGLQAMNSAFTDAAKAGITVLAASGDDLATDGETDGRAHVDFPASSPLVIGCGGTRIDTAQQQIVGEVVWNQGGSGTGGGISDRFAAPAYQSNAKLPKSVSSGHSGRGVPDVSGDADPASGYRVVVNGIGGLIGGTSAVAPLWAGLFALVNEKATRPAGFAQPLLYGNPNAFADIIKGDNKVGGLGYTAGKGWDACTGLGRPIGDKIAKLFP